MIKKLTTIAALAAAVMLAPAAQVPAHALTGLGTAPVPANSMITEVRHGVHIGGMGHFRGGGPRFHGMHVRGPHLNLRGIPGRHFRGRHFYGGPAFAYRPLRHRRHFRAFYGYGYYPYAYGGGYYGGCYWLKARALETGDPYWWDRYEDCID